MTSAAPWWFRAALSGLNIEGNTIYALRQPAYVSGPTTGTVQNNYVYGTKGWVLEGGESDLHRQYMGYRSECQRL